MKKLIYILSTLFFLIFQSCSSDEDCNNGIQDGDETGIDCGGPCPNCPETDPTLLMLQKKWFLKKTISNINPSTPLINLYYNENCAIEFTNIPEATNSSAYSFVLKGYYGGCNYPQKSAYVYDPVDQIISNIYKIESITSDELILKTLSSNQYLYYKTTQSKPNEINLKLQLEIEPTTENLELAVLSGFPGLPFPSSFNFLTNDVFFYEYETDFIFSATKLISTNIVFSTYIGTIPNNTIKFKMKFISNSEVIYIEDFKYNSYAGSGYSFYFNY